MMQRYILADVFTSEPFKGNPLAVFPDAAGMSGEGMQAIARELNLSETAFVSPPSSPDATHRVRIFTPTMELMFAGHPTIGTAIVLRSLMGSSCADQTVEMRFEEGIGTIPVRIDLTCENGFSATLTTAGARIRSLDLSTASLAALLSIEPDGIGDIVLNPAAVTAGVAFTMIPLRSINDLANCALRLDLWRDHLAGAEAPQVYPFVVDREAGEVHVRMFAPALGQLEDSATGAAAAALGSYLSQSYRLPGPSKWTIKQGAFIGRPSVLKVAVHPQQNGSDRVELIGAATIIGNGRILAHPSDSPRFEET